MNLLSIIMMAMALAGKYLFSAIMLCPCVFFVIGMMLKKEKRLDYLLILSGCLFTFFLSFVVFLKELIMQLGFMFPSQRPIETWNGAILFIATGIIMILIVPLSVWLLDSVRAMSIAMFKTNDLNIAGESVGKVYSKALSRGRVLFTRLRALDFGGRYD